MENRQVFNTTEVRVNKIWSKNSMQAAYTQQPLTVVSAECHR